MAKLVPIDQAPTPRRLVPLDDAPDPELTGYTTGATMSAAPTDDFRTTPNDNLFGLPYDPQTEMPATDSVGMERNDAVLQYPAQKMASGLGKIAGAPIDIANLAVNAGSWLRNLVGIETPYVTEPVGGGDWINDQSAEIAKSLLGEGAVIDESTLTPKERIVGGAIDFGTQALAGGAMLARRAPAAVARNAATGFNKGGNFATRFLDRQSLAYAQDPARVIAGDVGGGVGAGGANQAYEEYVPDDVKDSLGVAGPLGSVILGGFGGAGVQSIGQGVTEGLVNRAARTFGKGNYQIGSEIPTLPATRPTSRDMDLAAWRAQGFVKDPNVAADSLEANVNALREAGVPIENMPTTGALSDDAGMAMTEKKARMGDQNTQRRFVERDEQMRTEAMKQASKAQPADASSRDFTDFANRTTKERLRSADDMGERALAIETQMTDRDRQALEAQRPVSPDAARVDAARGQGPEASRRIAADWRAQERDVTRQQHALFSDPEVRNAPVDPQRALDIADEVEATVRLSTSEANVPTDLLARMRSFAPDPETGEAPPMTFGDVQEFRADISTAIDTAMEKTGTGKAGPLVERLRRLRDGLAQYEDDIVAQGGTAGTRVRQGMDYHRDTVRPRFREGESGLLRRQTRADPNEQRIRPEDVAGRFLDGNSRSKAESLNRSVLDAVPERAQDARTYLLDKLAQTSVVDRQTDLLRPNRLREWERANAEVIDTVPGMRADVDRMLAEARQGQEITGRIADEVRQLDQNSRVAQTRIGMDVKSRRKEIEKSPIAMASDKSPFKAVSAVMGSGDPERAMRQLVLDTGPDEAARDGLKKAVAKWMSRKITNPAPELEVEGGRSASFSKTNNLFDEHEKTLAEVFDPEEMNALRTMNRIITLDANRRARTGTNSATAENVGLFGTSKKIQNALEAALKLRYGALKGGGIMRSLRIASESLASGPTTVDQLLLEMQFDPELAMHLLRRDVSKVGTPDWNAKLNRILGVAAAARESTAPEGDNAEN
jgi:hypothetical protein